MLKIKAPAVLALLLAGSAVATWVFWRGVTFSAALDDDSLAAALSSDASVRKAQHGVEELMRRWQANAPGMDRWTERLVIVSRRPEPPIRRAAAWAMQNALRDGPAVARLREMIASETDECARRMAACSIAFSEDPALALPVLRAMLAPHVATAPAAGRVESVSAVGRRPREDEMVARLRGEGGSRIEALAGVPGRIAELRVKAGDVVAAGAPLVVIVPEETHVLAAANALARAGTVADAELLKPFARAGRDVTDAMARQCSAAIEWIRAREASGGGTK